MSLRTRIEAEIGPLTDWVAFRDLLIDVLVGAGYADVAAPIRSVYGPTMHDDPRAIADLIVLVADVTDSAARDALYSVAHLSNAGAADIYRQLLTVADTLLEGGGMPAGTFNFSRAYLAHYKATAAPLIVCYGDSTTAGGFSDGTQVGLWSAAYPAKLADFLTQYGRAAQNDSFFGDLNINQFTAFGPHDPRLSFGAGWAATTIVLGGKDWFNNSTTNVMSFTPTHDFDTLDVYWLGGNVGNFNINLDGGSNTNVPTNVAPVHLNKTTITGSLGPHTVNVARVAGNEHIVGMVARTAGADVARVANLGQYGARSSNLAAAVNPYDPKPSLERLAPDLTIINIGINDMLNAVTAATFKTNVQAIITSAKLSGDALLQVTNNVNITGVAQSVQDEFSVAVHELAVDNNCVGFDIPARWGNYVAANASGKMADFNHPGGAGYSDIADGMAKLLMAA